MRNVGPGPGLLALGGVGIAFLNFTYRDFAPMWRSFPPGLPWRETWVYGSGLLVLAASAGLCFSRTALPSVLTLGTYLAVWPITQAAPIALKPLSLGSWYSFCEALAPVLGAWIIYSALRKQPRESRAPLITSGRAVRSAQVLFGLNCVVYGMGHFAFADFSATFVPTWLPDRLGLAYFTGICHSAAGIGLAFGILPRLAATLEAIMMSLFGLLVWLPSLFAQPPPAWATPPQNQWSEIVVTVLLAASAWIVATSLRNRPWGFASRVRLDISRRDVNR